MLAIAAGLACLIAYGIALDGPLFFDDLPNLLDNDQVQINGSAFDEWRVAALSSDAGSTHRPVAMLTFAVNHVLAGGFSAFGLKLSNLLVHLANGGLVYLLALAILGAPALGWRAGEGSAHRMVALLAAAVWLLHPIHVSTVLYAVQRMALLSAFFSLAGLLVFLRYRLRWAHDGASTGEILAGLLWIGLLTLLATLSKENGALLPLLVLAAEVTLFRGIWRGQSRGLLLVSGWLLFALPFLCLLVLLLLAPEYLAGLYVGREFTLEERLLTQARFLWQYLGWLLVPNVFEMGFFHDDITVSSNLWTPWTTLLSLVSWILAISAALALHRRFPLAAFALLFYLAGHLMESSVIPLEMVFEHRNYLPSLGPLLLLAALTVHACRRMAEPARRMLPLTVVLLLAVLLGLRTQAWTDSFSLARFNAINHPDSPRANFYYGNALYQRFHQARRDGAPEEEERALAVAARRHFMRMHELDDRDVAGLVMLYQIDARHFPGLAAENDWLGRLEVLLETRVLQSSDRTAIKALVGFTLASTDTAARTRIRAMLDALVWRHPWHVDLLAAKFRMVKAMGDSEGYPMSQALERAARYNRESPAVPAYAAQFHGTAQLDETYEAIREWMRRDALRREIAAIREIFGDE